MIRLGSFVILAVFLIFNLGLFGFYFFFKKNTDDTFLSINRQETAVKNLAQTEKLYGQLRQKLSFLAAIWIEPSKVNHSLVLVNGFMGPQASLEKMNLKQDGLISLNLSSSDSSNLEFFLNKAKQLEQDGKIKDPKIDSVKKNLADKESIDYKFVLNFKLGDK